MTPRAPHFTRPPKPPRMVADGYDPMEVRCSWCGGRFCFSGCGIGEPGWVYVKATGWYRSDELTPELELDAECEGCGGTRSHHVAPDCVHKRHLSTCRPDVERNGYDAPRWNCGPGCPLAPDAEGSER